MSDVRDRLNSHPIKTLNGLIRGIKKELPLALSLNKKRYSKSQLIDHLVMLGGKKLIDLSKIPMLPKKKGKPRGNAVVKAEKEAKAKSPPKNIKEINKLVSKASTKEELLEIKKKYGTNSKVVNLEDEAVKEVKDSLEGIDKSSITIDDYSMFTDTLNGEIQIIEKSGLNKDSRSKLYKKVFAKFKPIFAKLVEKKKKKIIIKIKKKEPQAKQSEEPKKKVIIIKKKKPRTEKQLANDKKLGENAKKKAADKKETKSGSTEEIEFNEIAGELFTNKYNPASIEKRIKSFSDRIKLNEKITQIQEDIQNKLFSVPPILREKLEKRIKSIERSSKKLKNLKT
tara:strand:+ start:2765 stop:3784 length:1020 start_codon:yes stop_codon:yes gene_type:complete